MLIHTEFERRTEEMAQKSKAMANLTKDSDLISSTHTVSQNSLTKVPGNLALFFGTWYIDIHVYKTSTHI